MLGKVYAYGAGGGFPPFLRGFRGWGLGLEYGVIPIGFGRGIGEPVTSFCLVLEYVSFVRCWGSVKATRSIESDDYKGKEYT